MIVISIKSNRGQ